jgi:glucokinase
MSMRGGIDLGGTKIQAAVVDAAGGLLGDARGPTPHTGGPPDVIGAMAAVLRDAAAAAGVDAGKLAGVGVGSPGDVDADAGTVSNVVNLPGWDGAVPVADELGSALGVPVVLGNDVQVATEAEVSLGAGRDLRVPSGSG